jgi:hypothetical protein
VLRSQIGLQLSKIWTQKWKESLGYFELKKHAPLFDEGCSKLLDRRKHARLQDPSEINWDNLAM